MRVPSHPMALCFQQGLLPNMEYDFAVPLLQIEESI